MQPEYNLGVQVTPSWGWILVYEYTFMFMFIFYGKFLHYCAVAGKQPGISHYTPSKVRLCAVLQSLVVVCLEDSSARHNLLREQISESLNTCHKWEWL